MTQQILKIGDCREVLKTMEPESINCVVTSPPYFNQRDYGTEPLIWDGDLDCEHEWEMTPIKEKSHENEGFNERWGHSPGQKKQEKMKEIDTEGGVCRLCGAWKGQLGLEHSLELYLKHLCDIFDQIKRVLRKDGTCWVVIGDTYSTKPCGSFNQGGDVFAGRDMRGIETSGKLDKTKSGIPMKSLMQIPSRFAIEMVDRGWILRNEIIWHKPACMPSSAKDRLTIDFEKIFFFVKNQKYWFERQLENAKKEHLWRYKYEFQGQDFSGPNQDGENFKGIRATRGERNKRAVWTIPTQPYSEAHFSTFPLNLIETPIKAGCPKEVCKKCGVPREAIWEKSWDKPVEKANRIGNLLDWKEIGASRMNQGEYPIGVHHKLIGYTDCGCNAGFEPGWVLDPFAGSGTVLEYCKENGYNVIGVELNPDYEKLIRKRANMIERGPMDDY